MALTRRRCMVKGRGRSLGGQGCFIMTRGSSFPCVTDGAGKADGGAGRLDEVAEKSREDRG